MSGVTVAERRIRPIGLLGFGSYAGSLTVLRDHFSFESTRAAQGI
jgi:hypothetical protein